MNTPCTNTPCARCGYDPTARVTDRWELVLPLELASLNAHHVNVGHARHAYRRARDGWQWALKVGRTNGHVPIATTKRRVTITRLYSGRQQERDYDNLVGGAKPCVDAMVREGLIAGDDPARAEIHYLQERGTTRGTIVLIEELG